MTDERRVDNSSNRHRRGLTLHARFRKVSLSDEIGQALEKLPQMNGRAVVVKKPLRKNRDGNNATNQDEPHQRPPFLHVVDHPELIDEQRATCKTGSRFRATGVGLAAIYRRKQRGF